MDASAVFNTLVQQIQSSHLNFRLELSPFSANISLKKSFIRNKSGIPLLPYPGDNIPATENCEAKMKLLKVQVKQLHNENETLTKNYNEELVESEVLSTKL